MSSVNIFMQDEMMAEPSVAAPPSTPELFQPIRHTLRRTGMRPYVFDGSEVAHAMSYMPGSPLWYDVTLYRAGVGKFVVSVKLYYKDSNLPDRFSCHELATLDDVASFLESYDASEDVHPSVPMEVTTMTASEFAMHVGLLKLKIEEARAQFRDVAGEILYSLASGA